MYTSLQWGQTIHSLHESCTQFHRQNQNTRRRYLEVECKVECSCSERKVVKECDSQNNDYWFTSTEKKPTQSELLTNSKTFECGRRKQCITCGVHFIEARTNQNHRTKNNEQEGRRRCPCMMVSRYCVEYGYDIQPLLPAKLNPMTKQLVPSIKRRLYNMT